jgi:PAS domain S-box-containing protein
LRTKSSGVGISQERILATVAVDLPMIVSDQQGIIRYATEPMEELALAEPGELIGLNTTEIMPERYRAHHTAGVERFVKTGQGRLIGKVVNVDLLRRDGTEIPISLAFTASRSEDHDWFIAIIWARETYDQPAAEGVNVRQDEREARQNDQGATLEARRLQQDARDAEQNVRDGTQDVRQGKQDIREGRQDERDAGTEPGTESVNIRQDVREVSQNEEDGNLEVRRIQQDQREERQNKRDDDQ